MRFLLPLGLVALLVSFASPFAPAQDDATPLQESMGKIQSSMRTLRKGMKDPAAHEADLLRAIAVAHEGALEAYSLIPPCPKDEDEHAWRIGYKKQMLGTLGLILDCETAIRAGDAEALSAAYSGLGRSKKSGHETYQK